MKKLLSTFFLFSVLFLVSCSGNDDEPKVTPDPLAIKCRPISSTSLDSIYGEGDSVHYYYNPAGQLIKEEFYYISNGSSRLTGNFEFTYDQSGRIYQIKSSGVLQEERLYSPNGVLKQVSKYYINSSNVNTLGQEAEIEYDQSGFLKKITYYNVETSPKQISELRKFISYPDGTIASDSNFIGTGSGFFNTSVYLYDNKIGVAEYGLDFMSEQPYLNFPIKHNMISQIKTNASGGSLKRTYQYQYNGHDYPIRIKIVKDGSGFNNVVEKIVKIRYECL